MNQKNGIEIIVTGDFCPIKRIEQLCIEKKYDLLFNDALPMLQNNDLSISNLECPLTLTNKPINKIGPSLKASPECIKGIKFGGFNVVTLANNHILDYGATGLCDTINLCENNNIKTVGAGKNLKEASKPLVISIKNKTISIINVAEIEFATANKNKAGAYPLDIIDNYKQIKYAQQNSDIVIVIVHGGVENYSLPSPHIVKTYRFFASLGVSAVIGHHTHTASGFELYNNVPIFYSLGNFLFDNEPYSNKKWHESFFVKLHIAKSNDITFDIIPFIQCDEKAGIRLMNDTEKISFLKNIKNLNKIIDNTDELNKKWNEYCESVKNKYETFLLPKNKILLKLIKLRIINPKLLSLNKTLLLNIIRCDSHREILLKTLKIT